MDPELTSPGDSSHSFLRPEPSTLYLDDQLSICGRGARAILRKPGAGGQCIASTAI